MSSAYLSRAVNVSKDEISCTSLQQQWGKPRGKKVMPDNINDIRLLKPHVKCCKRCVTSTLFNNRFSFCFRFIKFLLCM